MMADFALILPALLKKCIVHFAENDNRIQGIVVIGRNGTWMESQCQGSKGVGDLGTYAADRGTTIAASRS
jgi:hypothetical protein